MWVCIINDSLIQISESTILTFAFYHPGRHKTKSIYGSALLTLSPTLYELVMDFIEIIKLERASVGATFSYDQNAFSQRNGKALTQLSGIIGDASQSVRMKYTVQRQLLNIQIHDKDRVCVLCLYSQ